MIKCPFCKNDLTDHIGKLYGKLGGISTKKRYGKKHYSDIGKKGMASRWGDKSTKQTT